jgi:subtilisin family serine protease
MMSKAVSATLGISKKAALTIVRLPRSVPSMAELQAWINNGSPSKSSLNLRWAPFVDALQKIWAELNPSGQEGQSQRKVVINMSVVWEMRNTGYTLANYPPLPGDDIYSAYAIMERLSNQGVIFVAASGNRGAPTMSDVCFIPVFPLNTKSVI